MASVDDNVLEVIIERWFKRRLENVGFKVVKLVTPGYSGTPDRLILYPKYAPAAPAVTEIKRFNAKARALQLAVHREWQARGVRVLEVIDGKETAMRVSDMLIAEVDEKRKRALEAHDETTHEIDVRVRRRLADRGYKEFEAE